MLSIIACYSKNRVIGKDGKLPWHLPDDLAHFKSITQGHCLIMGRKTYESLPKKLNDRKIIVVSKNKKFNAWKVSDSFDNAVKTAKKYDDAPIVCGGGEIFNLALPYVDKMYITEIDEIVQGDTFFPYFNPNEWHIINSVKKDNLTFKTFIRALSL